MSEHAADATQKDEFELELDRQREILQNHLVQSYKFV